MSNKETQFFGQHTQYTIVLLCGKRWATVKTLESDADGDSFLGWRRSNRYAHLLHVMTGKSVRAQSMITTWATREWGASGAAASTARVRARIDALTDADIDATR